MPRNWIVTASGFQGRTEQRERILVREYERGEYEQKKKKKKKKRKNKLEDERWKNWCVKKKYMANMKEREQEQEECMKRKRNRKERPKKVSNHPHVLMLTKQPNKQVENHNKNKHQRPNGIRRQTLDTAPRREERREATRFVRKQKQKRHRWDSRKRKTKITTRLKEEKKNKKRRRTSRQRVTLKLESYLDCFKTLWARLTRNPEVSTGPLVRPFARSLALFTHLLALPCLPYSRTLLRTFARSIARSLTSRLWESKLLEVYFFCVFFSILAIVLQDASHYPGPEGWSCWVVCQVR